VDALFMEMKPPILLYNICGLPNKEEENLADLK
jgi:hypothetical protein